MSVTIDHFAQLIQRFPTWEELKPHLESAEMGLRVIDATAPSPFAVIRYVKGKSVAGPGADWFRSVVWNTATNLPFCIAPPKAHEGLPPIECQLSATEDFVDGFMINAFVGTDGNIEVATRTQVGGTNTFYSNKTFGQMFDEALATTPLKNREGLQAQLEAIRGTAAAAFASFVVQHPEHRVVVKVDRPSTWVVHLGTIAAGTGVANLEQRANTWPVTFQRLQVPSYPVRVFHSEQEVQDLLRKTAVQRGWRWQGLVFKDSTGVRWRQRTPTYTLLRELRGAEASAAERFLRLREDHKVSDYLKHYNEDREVFWSYEQKLRARTEDVFAAYVDVHKAHSITFKDLPAAYKPAVYVLHLHWRDVLRAKGFKVRLQNVIEVVNKMRPYEKMRLMEAEAYVPAQVAAPKQYQDKNDAEPVAEDKKGAGLAFAVMMGALAVEGQQDTTEGSSSSSELEGFL